MKLLKSFNTWWRRRMSAWESAGQGRRFLNFSATSSAINSLLLNHSETLRARSRHLVRNNPYAMRAIEALVANCVGTGIKPQSIARDSSFRNQVQGLWLRWSEWADFEGQLDFYGLQALITRAMIEGGECLVRLIVAQDCTPVPLQLQVLEAEHLAPLNHTLKNGHRIRGGIEVNRKGQRVAYHLTLDHPGESTTFDPQKVIRVPAEQVLHIYRPLRPGQLRGEPWLSRVLLKLYELDQYDDAEVVRKKTSAMFAGFITRLDPEGSFMGEQLSDEGGVSFAGLQPGTLQMLGPGEDVKFSEPSDVGGSYEAFMRQQLRAIAIGMGITYEQLTGDLTGVNYSSIRAGLIEFRRHCAALQHHILVHQLCRPVWHKWLQLALLKGALKQPLQDDLWEAVKWIAQGWEWVDPLKDQQAQQMAVRNGFKSRAQVVSELGYNVEDIDHEIACDHLRAESLNLHYDSHIKRQ